MDTKRAGIDCYLKHMKELMHFAHTRGVECLCIEPMSCIAEPPTLPNEITSMAEELMAYHADHSDTSRIGYCADISHGYADANGNVIHSNIELFQHCFPHLAEIHLRNTDNIFNSTFGFTEPERKRGIVDLAAVRDLIYANAATIPQSELCAYFEIGGPKLGRDYSDQQLEDMLRESLRHMVEVFSKQTSTIK